ncbi:MAG TPA: hypothetical protein VLF60_01310 [Candidatus Saccharimonadales bacterium]|nr:hypothetical protein [Candidatus Saccharimonadales bacterium]
MELIKSKTASRRFKVGDLLHFLLNLALPVVIFLLASQWQLYAVALALILLSKWRIFAVQPRFWWANIQANLIDVLVGVSILGLMFQAKDSMAFQAVWAALYAIWLVAIKPQSGSGAVSLQAAIGQALGITALFWYADQANDLLIVAGTWVVAYSAARHVVSSYEEDLLVLLSAVWGLFVAEIAWLLNRWLVVYTIGHHASVPQITLIVLIVGYCAAHLYDYSKQGKLTARQVQYVFGFGGLLLFLVLTIFSNWSGSV